MKINSIKSPYSFKGATVNINAFSDVQGHIERADCAYQTMLKNKAFENERQKGKINFLINGGDWFVSSGNIDFKSSLNERFGEFQLLMCNKLIDTIKKSYPKLKTVFVPGNHEFDGGEEFFNRIIKETKTDFVSTNIDMSNSPAITSKGLSDKVLTSKIDFVSDDKNPKINYPILNVGISPLNM